MSATMGAVFTHVARDPIRSHELARDGLRRAAARAAHRERAGAAGAADARAAQSAGRLAPPLRGGSVFTDDRAPVEWLIDASIVSYAAEENAVSAAAVSACPSAGASSRPSCSCAGMTTLGAEIAAARLIAPAFGASTVVWANTIAIVLVALAGGYWLGGRLAGPPSARARDGARRRCSGAGLVALIPLLAIPLLGVTEDSLGEFAGSLLAQLVLVAPPVLVLGALSPWAIRLRVRSVDGAGDVTGRLYALVHGGRARRQLRRRAGADPAGRHALDVPDLRGAARRRLRSDGMVLQACLNGDRETGVPRSPAELAAAARACVAAGAASLHAHPRDPDGHESLDAADIAAAVARAARGRAGRRAVASPPGCGSRPATSTPAPAPITEWTELPDLVSLNLTEEGWRELADAARRARDRDRGRRVERPRGAEDLARRAALQVRRVLVEPRSENAERGGRDGATRSTPRSTRAAMPAPRLHHGVGPATWAVLDAAVPRGHEIRIGLEDVLTLPDGRRAPDNAALVVEAVLRYA